MLAISHLGKLLAVQDVGQDNTYQVTFVVLAAKRLMKFSNFWMTSSWVRGHQLRLHP